MCSHRYATFAIACLLAVCARTEPLTLGVMAPDAGGTVPATGARVVFVLAAWAQIQPTATRWEFAALDRQVAAAQQAGQEVVLVCGATPQWATRDLSAPTPEEAHRAMPKLEAYRAFIGGLVRRYRGKVLGIQVWRRLNGTHLLVATPDAQALCRAGTEAVHQSNPAMRAIVPEPGDVNLGWIHDYLAAARGAARPDILLLASVRYTCAPHTLAWRLQTLITRVCPEEAPRLWLLLPAGEDTAGQLSLAAAALPYGITGLVLPYEKDARATLSLLTPLQGATYRGWLTVSGQQAVVMRRGESSDTLLIPAGPATLVVQPEVSPDALAVPDGQLEVRTTAEVRRVEIARRTEVAVEGPALVSGAQAHARSGYPDNAPAAIGTSTVSLDPRGADPGRICPLRAQSGGQYTIGEHAGQPVLGTIRETAPWIHLDIPDGFLFLNLARTPIEVMIHVLGVQQARRTGFNLYYDAIDGMRTSPWQWIETGSNTVYSYRVVLRDALCSNREGYDIRINRGGSLEEVRVLGVEVRKVAP